MRIPTKSQHLRTTRSLCAALTAVTMALAVTACRGKEPGPSRAALTCPLGMHRAAAQDICISGGCGDGNISQGEACDDGNHIAGDGCSPDCGSVEMCGNGVVDEVVGEVCDDGNLAAGDACCGDCRPCPALARPVATEPPRDSLPDTRPCPALLAEKPATPDVPTLAEAPATPDVPTPPVEAPATPDVPTPPVEALATSDVPMPSVEAPDAPTRRPARRSRSRKSRSRDREYSDITELEETNMLLQQSLEAERQQHEELQERISRGRTDELD